MQVKYLKNKIIVYLSLHHGWEDYWHFYQLVANEFSKYNEIIYVNPPINILSVGRQVLAMLGKKKTKRINENLEVYTPVIYPFRKHLPSLSQEKFKLDIMNLLKQYAVSAEGAESKELIFWVNSPYLTVSLLKEFPKSKKIYFVADEVTMSGENELMEIVDYIFTVSSIVYDERNKLYPQKTYLLNTACDFTYFQKILNSNISFSDELKQINSPIIGYIGSITNRIDWELIEYLADLYPFYSFVFVGSKIHKPKLKRKNIHFFELNDRENIAYFLKSFDVGIIPYRLNSFNLHCNPIKFYGYCSMGKPVVSTDIPELRKFEEAILIAHSKQEFGYLLSEAVNEARIKKFDSEFMIRIAKEHSAESFFEKVDNLLKNG